MTYDLVMHAARFASAAHINHFRKYTNEPYINHLKEVADTVQSVEPGNTVAIAAAWLHDVVEDGHITNVTPGDLAKEFGFEVTSYVRWLTDTNNMTINRAARKSYDRERLAAAPASVQTIKLADLISNSRSIAQHDPKFAVVYMKEKEQLLDVMTKGNAALYKIAFGILRDYYLNKLETK
jgi:(p)ppGpp synthase/HD superfamily hydrolase